MKTIALGARRAATPVLGFAVFAVAFLLAACGKSPTQPNVKPVPIILKVPGAASGAPRTLAARRAASFTAADTETIHVDQHDVVLTRALLVVRDVRFMVGDDEFDDEDTTGTGGSASDSLGEDDDDEDDGGAVIFRGPFVLDLLSHSEATLDTEMVMPGTYHHVQGHLQALHAGDAAATPDLSFLIGSTVYLEGEILGEGGGTFTYLERIDNEFQIRGSFTVEADTPATSFLTFDVSRWLTGRDGQFLDPRVEENHKWIEQAIRHAIKFGIDEDHDGEVDDDDMEGSDG